MNAYDAAVAAHVNIGLLRQQMRPVDRVHGCMLEGPKVANVIGHYTKLSYVARSDTRQAVDVLEKKVLACFEAAALSTGCEVKITRWVVKTRECDITVLIMAQKHWVFGCH